MKLYERIRQRRIELGMSQETLAFKLGYRSRSTINKIELGLNDISQSKIAAFAKALNTTPAYLMGWENDTEKGQPENEPPLTESETLLLELSADLPKEDMNKLIDYAQLLKKANNQ